jgi:hypothetical protein
MNLEMKLKNVCKDNGDIQIENVNLEEMNVDVLLPYETASVSIDLEGDNNDEIVESLKTGINGRLDEMINQLNDCKLY